LTTVSKVSLPAHNTDKDCHSFHVFKQKKFVDHVLLTQRLFVIILLKHTRVAHAKV